MNAPEPIPFDMSAMWPDPDMTLIKPARPEPPEMPDEAFNAVFGPWAGWLRDAAEVKGTPLDYVALALLTTASACIGNARWAVPWEGWKEPPVLWAILIGDPSAGKSPALDAVLDPVKVIEGEMADTYKAARQKWEDADEIASLIQAQWKADAKKAVAESDSAPAKPEDADAGRPPVRERIRISDATVEKVAELLAASWRGLLMSRDELSGWLGSMDRYNGGGDRPFWLEAYGGRPYTVDRKSNPEPVMVDHLSVSVLGGTQPDKLDSLLVKTDDDGLLARFLTVYPAAVPLARPKARLDEARLVEGLKRLRSLQPARDEAGHQRPFFVHLTEAAGDALQEFRQQCRNWEAEAEGVFKGHIGKLPGLAVRVACVLAHLDYAASANAMMPTEIDSAHIGRACHLVGEHYRLHAFRAYGASKPTQEIEGARTIGCIIRTEGLIRFKVRDIQHRERAGLKTSRDVKTALKVLIEADWLREVRENSGGRPSITYAVNPKLGGTS
jgi:uncharacterized protein DUF3987